MSSIIDPNRTLTKYWIEEFSIFSIPSNQDWFFNWERQMTDEECFLLAIEKNPESIRSKLVYADWLDDNDRGFDGDAMRWLAANGRYPYHLVGKTIDEWLWGIEWPNFILRRVPGLKPEPHHLPREVYRRLEEDHMSKGYSTFRDAIEWFFFAFASAMEKPSWLEWLRGYRRWVPNYQMNQPSDESIRCKITFSKDGSARVMR